MVMPKHLNFFIFFILSSALIFNHGALGFPLKIEREDPLGLASPETLMEPDEDIMDEPDATEASDSVAYFGHHHHHHHHHHHDHHHDKDHGHDHDKDHGHDHC
ncbi:hypothetical protein DFH28DRAFT_1121708 [Melampsora americana]|nr:hypothetical protein DFH28DRAFT_1121708 [Melampsora americana]